MPNWLNENWRNGFVEGAQYAGKSIQKHIDSREADKKYDNSRSEHIDTQVTALDKLKQLDYARREAVEHVKHMVLEACQLVAGDARIGADKAIRAINEVLKEYQESLKAYEDRKRGIYRHDYEEELDANE